MESGIYDHKNKKIEKEIFQARDLKQMKSLELNKEFKEILALQLFYKLRRLERKE